MALDDKGVQVAMPQPRNRVLMPRSSKLTVAWRFTPRSRRSASLNCTVDSRPVCSSGNSLLNLTLLPRRRRLRPSGSASSRFNVPDFSSR